MKAFLIDMTKCNGCYDCQIGCKDEHCEQAWLPYAEAQPETGQFWLNLKQQERGANSHVRVTYTPTLCNHCNKPACMEAATDGAVYKREDGLVIIDPVKAKGQKQIVDACPYHVVYWNEDLQLPQKCTGCAHLIDDEDSPIRVPRCMDNCPVQVITFGEKDQLDLTDTEVLHPEYGTEPQVFYRGLPKRFIAGTVYDPKEMEVVIGATVTAVEAEGVETWSATTNDWGDFCLDGLPEADFKLEIKKGDKVMNIDVSTKEKDQGLADIALA